MLLNSISATNINLDQIILIKKTAKEQNKIWSIYEEGMIIMNRNLRVIDLKKKDFNDFYKLNYRMWLQRVANDISDSVVFAEHPHVILVGKKGNIKEVMIPSALNRREKIPVYEVEWEGASSYRGPGQLGIYPVVHLNRQGMDIGEFKNKIGEIMIALLHQYGIKAEQHPEKPGIWVGENKIASIDIEAYQQVTRHGISLNVNPRLSLFRMLQSAEVGMCHVTSMYNILKKKVDTDVLKIQFVNMFQEEFGLKSQSVSS